MEAALFRLVAKPTTERTKTIHNDTGRELAEEQAACLSSMRVAIQSECNDTLRPVGGLGNGRK